MSLQITTSKKENIFFYLYSIILCLYSATVVAIPIATGIGTITLLILLLISGDYKQKINTIIANKSIWVLFLLIIISGLGLLYSDEADPKYVIALFKLLIIFISILFFLKKYPFMTSKLLLIFVVSVIVLTILSTFNFLFLDYNLFIHFAPEDAFPMASSQSEMAIALVIASVLLISYSENKIGCKKYILILLSIFLIFCEYYINQSRTGYLMEVVVIVYYAFYFCFPFNISFNKHIFNFKRAISILLICFIAPIAIYNSSDIFKSRVDSASHEVASYINKDSVEKSKTTSVGYRLSWYYTGYKTITSSTDKFIFGCGTGSFKDCTQKVIDNSSEADKAKMQAPDNNPHSQFIFFFLQSGVIGFIAFVAFIASIIISTKKSDYKIPLYLIVIAFCVGCLFNNFMLDLRTGPIFVMVICFLLSTKYRNN